MKKWLGAAIVVLHSNAVPALAKKAGSISGKVTSADGEPLPGVTVEATSNVLPQARQTVSAANGEFRLPLLPPGTYEISFTLEGMATEKRSVLVALQQSSTVDVALAVSAVAEEIEVVALSSLVNPVSAELRSSVTAETIEALPVGQEYRDLVKLIPGVQYSEDEVRGPSAGGSGQDNTYQFDGVNVTLPLFGVLSAEPSSHDIDQIAIVKGGASATDFNRSSGFSINSISRSGTNDFHAALTYQIQPESLVADRENAGSTFEEDKDWIIGNVGGPIVQDHLYFYASYYAPSSTKESRANLYGDVPDFESDRDEYFGKLTFAPTDAILLHGSYRSSDHTESSTSNLPATSAGSTSAGNEATLEIGIFEASWIIDSKSYANFRFTDFENQTAGLPDRAFGFDVALDGSVDLDIANLDQQGWVVVPGSAGANAFQQQYINRYGYVENGVVKGGGRVGGHFQFDDDDFYRQSYQASYDRSIGTRITHDLHLGYQWYTDEEDLARTSNGWGEIRIPGGTTTCTVAPCTGQPIFFQTAVLQQGITLANGVQVPTIHSEYESQNFELNDSIHFSNVTLNMGLLISNDKLFGQGLRENDNTLSGFEIARGHKYMMHEIDWSDALQPRLGAVWNYSGANTIYANYARYVPAASSLPRAASWARNSAGLVNVFFDRNGNVIGSTPEAASSGKLFQADLDPRATDEYLLGTTYEFGGGWAARAHVRYRYSDNFWEDTNNTARIAFNPPPDVPRALYIPNLAAQVAQIGSGSSYVIAELDGAFTKYYEAGLETEWRGAKSYLSASYVWSHYYGNIDQDNSAGSAVDNDTAIFIGSSNIADGGGRQLWDLKYGDLRGDRRHKVKLFGYYRLPWNASVGAFGVYQSGQPWEMHNYRFYLPPNYPAGYVTNQSDTARYAESAGTRTASSHHQLDVNYTQDFPIGDRFNIQARVDIFNIYDNQTGYDIQHNFNTAQFGQPQSFYDPRRFQFSVRFEF